MIKSTVPVGFTESIRSKHRTDEIIFCPAFSREGSALNENLFLDRVVVGGITDGSRAFANILKEAALKDEIEVLCMEPSEAEAIKLFSNTYLALRVFFFNELDSYAIA